MTWIAFALGFLLGACTLALVVVVLKELPRATKHRKPLHANTPNV